MPFAFDSSTARGAFARRVFAGAVAVLLAPALHAEPVKAVYDRAAAYKDESLLLLERLVDIDSGSGSTAGLEQVRRSSPPTGRPT